MIAHNQFAQAAGFAALIRTTGSRPLLLQDALQSLALQHGPCLPVVIVHGDAATYAEVQRICRDSSAADRVVILQAAETQRRRGYPINVGIEYCFTQCPDVEFIFFLDDDDIVYPFFTGTMRAAFLASGADVVYAASNRREPGKPASAGYSPKPIHHVLRENFITSNSYAIRASTLRNSGLRMNEELEYTEDWHFLIRMLQAGFLFHAFPATLSEFRIVSDGNLSLKRDPAAWSAISLEIRRYINTNSFPLPGPELVRLQSLLTEMEQRFLDVSARLNERASETILLNEMEQKFLDAHTRLNQKASEAQHLQNLLGEMEQKLLDASNRLTEKTSERQHYQNLLLEKIAEADGMRLQAHELISSVSALREQLALEQEAHLLADQELAALKAKLSRLPLRLLVR